MSQLRSFSMLISDGDGGWLAPGSADAAHLF